MANRSKAKGSSYEREVARLFSEWWGSEFKRTPNSGALRWQGVSWTYSDILPPEDCPVALECKIRKEVNLWALISPDLALSEEHNLVLWWNQSVEDAIRCYEETGNVIHPMLIFRQNHKKSFLALEADLVAALFGKHHHTFQTVWVSHPHARARFVILDLTTFFDRCTPEQFLEGQRKILPWSLVQTAQGVVA